MLIINTKTKLILVFVTKDLVVKVEYFHFTRSVHSPLTTMMCLLHDFVFLSSHVSSNIGIIEPISDYIKIPCRCHQVRTVPYTINDTELLTIDLKCNFEVFLRRHQNSVYLQVLEASQRESPEHQGETRMYRAVKFSSCGSSHCMMVEYLM